MEKSSSTPTQITEAPLPPCATSSLPAQGDLPLPTTTVDQRSAELPSLPMELDSSPAAQVPVTTDPSSRGRKRPLEGNIQIENSNYYKIRLLLKDLRPHVLEVLRTPDFRNTKAAIEIQEKMKLMLQLFQEMIGESPKLEKTTKTESLSNGKAIYQTPQTTTTTTTTELKSSETSYVQTEKHYSNGDGAKVGDTVVGGSAFGWNFVTYGGTEPVYAGMSKEDYRTSHPIIQTEAQLEFNNNNNTL